MLARKGFTIIELLITLVILGLLVSVAAVNYTTAQRRARDNARKTQVQAVANALETYYSANQRFPGKQDSTTDPLPDGMTYSLYNGVYLNCQTFDSLGSAPYPYLYYYYPLDTNAVDGIKKPCNNSSARPLLSNGTKTIYDPEDYSPFPAWIPGLSPYLNPAPIDSRYQGRYGSSDPSSSDADYAEVAQASDESSTNQTRTYVYRKLNGGYVVYTRLETQVQDAEAIIPGTTFTDKPALPLSIQTVDGKYVYMIRK